MDVELLSAIIGAAAFILGTVAQSLISAGRLRWRFGRMGLPNVVGTWQGEWWRQENGQETIFAQDTVRFEKVRGFDVYGTGASPLGNYLIKGRFATSGILTFYYQHDDDSSSLSGAATMRINATGRTLDGRFTSFTTEGDIIAGKVRFARGK